MARDMSQSGEKLLHWVGSSKRDFRLFPEQVRSDMGYALGLAQLGGRHPSTKQWKGEGPGVFEMVENHSGDTFRGVYTVRFAEMVYVLHCFQKKSPSGIRTASSDIELIHQRLKRAREDYEGT